MMILRRTLHALVFTLFLAATGSAAELTNPVGGFRITYPDSWIILAGAQSHSTIATRADPYRGHGVPYITGGAAVISVSPTVPGPGDYEHRRAWLEEDLARPTPGIADLRTEPASSTSMAQIEFVILENEVRDVVLYRKVGDRSFTISLEYNRDDPEGEHFREVLESVAASISEAKVPLAPKGP